MSPQPHTTDYHRKAGVQKVEERVEVGKSGKVEMVKMGGMVLLTQTTKDDGPYFERSALKIHAQTCTPDLSTN